MTQPEFSPASPTLTLPRPGVSGWWRASAVFLAILLCIGLAAAVNSKRKCSICKRSYRQRSRLNTSVFCRIKVAPPPCLPRWIRRTPRCNCSVSTAWSKAGTTPCRCGCLPSAPAVAGHAHRKTQDPTPQRQRQGSPFGHTSRRQRREQRGGGPRERPAFTLPLSGCRGTKSPLRLTRFAHDL